MRVQYSYVTSQHGNESVSGLALRQTTELHGLVWEVVLKGHDGLVVTMPVQWAKKSSGSLQARIVGYTSHICRADWQQVLLNVGSVNVAQWHAASVAKQAPWRENTQLAGTVEVVVVVTNDVVPVGFLLGATVAMVEARKQRSKRPSWQPSSAVTSQ